MNAVSYVSTVLCTCCHRTLHSLIFRRANKVIMMVAMSLYHPLWILECSDNSTSHNRWNCAGWSACRCTAWLTPRRKSNAQRDEVNERLGLGRVTQVEAMYWLLGRKDDASAATQVATTHSSPDRDTSIGNWSGTASANGKIDRCIGRSSEGVV